MKNDLSKFIGAIDQVARLNGKEIRDNIFSQKTVISKTPEEAMKRAAYEDYLKTGKAHSVEHAREICDEFIRDVLKKATE